jgi:lambda family phage portal protein
MSITERFIASLSPRWAAKRAHARMLLNRLDAIRSDDSGRLHRLRRQRQSANVRNQSQTVRARDEARWLEETNDIASGALDVICANVIGNGIAPEPQVMNKDGTPADELNTQLMRIWDDWIYTPEVTRQFDYYSCQQLAARTWFRDGEAFGQHLLGNIPSLDHGTIAPYSIEMLEPDFVPFDLTDPGRRIVQGIELNGWGRPIAYHILRGHPGDNSALGLGLSNDTKRVSADRIMHLKRVVRFHSVRGLSVFASSLTRFGDLKEIDESERVAARVAAAMAAYIKKGTPDLYEPPAPDESGDMPYRQMAMVPGMIFDDLLPGEEVGTIESHRPNNNLIPFRDSQLRSAAAGLGVSWSALSKNYNGTYSAQRQELVEQYVVYRRLSGQFIYRFCQPVWESFVTSLLAANALTITAQVDSTTLMDCMHTPPPMPWIDPLREAQANELLEKRGYKSRSRIIRERGDNPDSVNKEIRRDTDELSRLGITLERDGGGAPPADDSADEANEQTTESDSTAAPAKAYKTRQQRAPGIRIKARDKKPNGSAV